MERLKRRRGHIDLWAGEKLPTYAQLAALLPRYGRHRRFSPEMIFDAMLSNLQGLQENRDQSAGPGLRRRSAGAVDGGKIATVFFPWRALQALALTRAGWRSWRLWDSV
ncbi:MAG: hypothetical protein ACLSHU_04815 [Oscillospiraceae bacterium]